MKKFWKICDNKKCKEPFITTTAQQKFCRSVECTKSRNRVMNRKTRSRIETTCSVCKCKFMGWYNQRTCEKVECKRNKWNEYARKYRKEAVRRDIQANILPLHARYDNDVNVINTNEKKIRICLKCDNKFRSRSKINRLCKRCNRVNGYSSVLTYEVEM